MNVKTQAECIEVVRAKSTLVKGWNRLQSQSAIKYCSSSLKCLKYCIASTSNKQFQKVGHKKSIATT